MQDLVSILALLLIPLLLAWAGKDGSEMSEEERKAAP